MPETKTDAAAPETTDPVVTETTEPEASNAEPPENPTPPKAAPKPKKRDALAVQAEIDALADAARQISEGRADQIEALIEVQRKAKKLKLVAKSDTHVATMLGVTASSTAGDVPAMRNWANAARRRINALEVELR